MKFTILLAVIACLAVVEARSLARELLKRKLGSILDRLGLPRAHSSSGYSRGKSYAGEEYNNGESGSQGAAFHDAGRRNYHNIGQHHSKVTKITQAESSESHNIGGSEVYDKGAAADSRFNRYNNGAQQSANEYDRGQEQSISD